MRRPSRSVGCGTGTFTRRFLQKYHPEELVLNDICPEVEETLSDLLASADTDTASDGGSLSHTPLVRFVPGDAELCPLPGDRDLIVSCSVMQWFEDPGAFIVRCRTLRGGTPHPEFPFPVRCPAPPQAYRRDRHHPYRLDPRPAGGILSHVLRPLRLNRRQRTPHLPPHLPHCTERLIFKAPS